MNISCFRRNPIHGRFLVSGLLLTVIGAGAAAAMPAAAAAVHSAPPPGQISWSVTPATDKAPDSRELFAYGTLKPGTTISDHVAVLNRSAQSVAFSIYATDASGTTANGALTLLPANNKPTDIGSWATFPGHVSQLTTIIPGGKGIIEPFTLTVPRRATPGDHIGGMIASVGVPHRNAAGQMVTLYQRIAVPIELRVAGKLHAALRVDSVSVGFSNPVNPFGGGSVTVSYSVTNTGNVKLTGTQVVSVSGSLAGSTTVRAPKLPTVLPGDSIQYTVSAKGLYPAGSVAAHITVTPGWPANTTALPTPLTLASASSSMFAVPWALIVLIILLAGGGYGGWRTWRWRRRTHLAEVAIAAEQARLETERRLLGSQNGSASVTTPGSAQPRASTPDAGNEPG